MIHVASVARGNDVAGARILARGLAEHHPDWPLPSSSCRACGRHCIRARSRSSARPATSSEALPAGVPAALRAALARPLLVRHALDAGAERVLLLPPDAELRGPLDAFERSTSTPRCSSRACSAGCRRTASGPTRATCSTRARSTTSSWRCAATTRAAPLSSWWIERRREDVAAAGAGGGSTPRLAPSPLAAALGSLDGVARLEDPAYDVSYWNLHERSLADARLVRFAGFRADRPWWLSEHASRTLVLDDPALAEAAGRRAPGAA